LASIELKGITRRFPGGNAGLHPLELSIPAGELLVVLGPSGSAKTTLLRLIAGLEPPSSGSVWVGGQDLTGIPPHLRDVAMVFQHAALYPHLSVFDNLAFGIRSRRVPRTDLQAKVKRIAAMLELDRLLSRLPAELSGGERQRVAIGRALVRQPRVTLLDEPFSNLDLPLRTSLREQVVELQRRFGTTLVHVTHDQSEALVMGHRVAILSGGRLLQVAPPRVIYEKPATRFVATFVGSPPINVLPCQVEPEGEVARVRLLESGGTVSWTTTHSFLPAHWEGTSCRFDLGIRPESLWFVDPAGGLESSSTTPRFSAHVRQLAFHGPDVLATVAVGPCQLVARLPAQSNIAAGGAVTLALDMSRVTFFDSTTGTALESARK